MKKLYFVLCLVIGSLSVEAQTLTLDEAHRLARDNYPLVKRYNLISATEQITLSNIAKGWLPQVQAEAQATLQNRVMGWPDAMGGMFSQMGLDMKGLKKDQYKVGVTINQTIYDGGAIASQKQVAQAQTKVQVAQNDVDLYTLRERVDNIYFSLLLTDERIALSKEMQTTLQSNEDKLLAMARQGVATSADAEAVKAERLSAAQQQVQLETTRQALLQVLSAYVGQTVTAVTRPAAPAYSTTMQSSRPELRLFNEQIALTQKQESSLRSGLMPRLSVFATGYYGYPGYNMFADMMSHNSSWNGMIGAKFSWNISSLYTNKNNKRKLQTQRQDIETARDTFLFNTDLQSRQESETIKGYRDLLAKDNEIIALRRSVRQSAESKLSHGVVDVNTLVQEITRENQAAINRSTHEIELLQHQYAMQRINN